MHAEAPYLSSKFVEENFDFFRRYLQVVKQIPPRWKICTRLVDRDLGEALGQIFVAKAFSPQMKEEALKMTREIEVRQSSSSAASSLRSINLSIVVSGV